MGSSFYVLDDRVVLHLNFTDYAKMVTREEVLGSSAVDNAPPTWTPWAARLRGVVISTEFPVENCSMQRYPYDIQKICRIAKRFLSGIKDEQQPPQGSHWDDCGSWRTVAAMSLAPFTADGNQRIPCVLMI